MSAQHTPGPCQCITDCGDDTDIDRGLAKPCDTLIASRAYRALHNAAPQMLAALEGLLPYLPTEGDARTHASLNEGRATPWHVASINARAAIASARGRT